MEAEVLEAQWLALRLSSCDAFRHLFAVFLCYLRYTNRFCRHVCVTLRALSCDTAGLTGMLPCEAAPVPSHRGLVQGPAAAAKSRAGPGVSLRLSLSPVSRAVELGGWR